MEEPTASAPTQDAEPTVATPLVSGMMTAGFVVGLVPFVIHFGTTSTTTVNGVTESTSIDYVAIPCGGLAIVCGMASLVGAIGNSDRKTKRIGLAALLGLLGAFQLLRGFGLL